MQQLVSRFKTFNIRFLIAIVLLVSVLSACVGGSAPPSTPADATVEDTATPRPPATATPVPPTATPEPTIDLEGTCWTLVSYVDDQGNTVNVLPDTTVNAEFTADQIVGSAGCNRYFTAYQIEGSSLTLGPIGATRMACEEAINKQEFQYLAALESAATYKVVDGQLHIVDAEGTTVLTFAKADCNQGSGSTLPPSTATPVPPTATPGPPVDLEGTCWTLVSYVDDQGNTVNVLPDTTVNAKFTADQIVGSAGCNGYFTAYQIDGNSLTLGPIGATLMACGEAVGKQEIQYLAALESAATYKVVDDQLHIVDAEGTTVLTFAKAGCN